MELLLNIESYTYDKTQYRPAEWVGAVIKVQDPNGEPIPEEGGIPVAPGTLNRLAIEKVCIHCFYLLKSILTALATVFVIGVVCLLLSYHL